MKPFVNPVDMNIPVDANWEATHVERKDIDTTAFVAEDIVSPHEAEYVLGFLKNVAWQPVSITGMQGNYEPGDPIGSWRASSFQQEYSNVLFERIRSFIPEVKVCDDSTNTDWDGHSTWEPVGINPLLRFIKYTDGGLLIPHYDAPYIANDEERTLTSFVIYLDKDENVTGGEVAFLHDDQAHLPVVQRNLDDRVEPAHESDIKFMFSPNPRSAVVFDHRILHESRVLRGEGEKTIIRTDIMYKKTNVGK